MKHRNLKLKIIIITAIIITLAIIFAILFFFTDIFRTKRGAFFRYFSSTSSNLAILNNTDYDEFNKTQQSTPYIENGEMIVQSSSNVADSSIMDKLKLRVEGKVNNQKEKVNYNLTVTSNINELFSMSLAREKNMYAFNSPSITNGYIGIKNENLKEISSAIVGDIYIPNEITKLKFDKILEITKVEKTHVDSYFSLLKNNTQDSAFSKKSEKLQIDGELYNVVSYTLKLEKEESAKIQDEIYSKIIQDSIMMNYITSKLKLLNFDDQYTDINSLNLKIREKIEELRRNPENAETIEITVSESKQKNIKTTMKINDTTLAITHLNEGNKNIVILELNDKSIIIGKEDEYRIFKYSYSEDDIDKSIEIKTKLEGTIAENNINRIIEITTVNGIKVVNYSYRGKINFTNDIGTIETFDPNSSAILNNYSKEQIEPFMNQLKSKINNVYISKGASIGINLDPIFENVE